MLRFSFSASLALLHVCTKKRKACEKARIDGNQICISIPPFLPSFLSCSSINPFLVPIAIADWDRASCCCGIAWHGMHGSPVASCTCHGLPWHCQLPSADVAVGARAVFASILFSCLVRSNVYVCVFVCSRSSECVCV